MFAIRPSNVLEKHHSAIMNRERGNVLFILLKVQAGFPISFSAKDSLPALLIRKLQWGLARPAGSGNNFRAGSQCSETSASDASPTIKTAKGCNPSCGHMTLR